MEKKDLKLYETPVMEIVETEAEGCLMAGSPSGGGSDDITPDDGFGS